jgi:uncharacterized SAM-binding protein YcdF (DUF218 family)
LLLAGLLAVYLGRGWLLPAAARFLDVSEPPAPVDYVLVLGGGTDTRPFVAAALVRAGLTDKVLVAEVRPSPGVEDGLIPSEEEVVQRVLDRRGVPRDAVTVLPGPCDSTFDEARALGRFLDEKGACTVAVVTTNYHTRRARWVFRRVLGAKADRLRFVAPPTGGYDESNWWKFEAGLKAYANEYVKFLYYFLRY